MKKIEQQAGATLSVLPNFRPTLLQREHVFINSGVFEIDEIDGVFYPKADWRPISPSEFAVLTRRSPEQDAQRDRGALAAAGSPLISLIELPRHLRERWWSVAEQLLEDLCAASETESPEGRGFFQAVVEFLQFKRIPLSTSCTIEILVRQPGLKSSILYPSGFPGPAVHAGEIKAPAECPFFYIINLGDEPTSVWFLSISKDTVKSSTAAVTPANSDASRHHIVAQNPDCPSIRIKLQPGEGLAAWPQMALLGGDTLDGSEPEILLRIFPRK